jgi:hypothetical protein
MAKHIHIILPLCGLIVSFLAYIQFVGRTATESLHLLSRIEGLVTLLLEFSPFVALVALTSTARALHWRGAVLRASWITNYAISILSVGCYSVFLIFVRPPYYGHPGPGLLLWVIPLWSWCAIPVVWFLVWFVCAIREEGKNS